MKSGKRVVGAEAWTWLGLPNRLGDSLSDMKFASIRDGRLHCGDGDYRVLVLPRLVGVERRSLERILAPILREIGHFGNCCPAPRFAHGPLGCGRPTTARSPTLLPAIAMPRRKARNINGWFNRSDPRRRPSERAGPLRVHKRGRENLPGLDNGQWEALSGVQP
jgi:hypothetical protein